MNFKRLPKDRPATEEETLSVFDPLIRVLAARRARSVRITGAEPEDWLVIAQIGAVEAHRTYDPASGATFRTYLSNVIRWAFTRATRLECGCGPQVGDYLARLQVYANGYREGKVSEREIAQDTGLSVTLLRQILPRIPPPTVGLHYALPECADLCYEDVLWDRNAVDPEEAVTGVFGTLDAQAFWADVRAILGDREDLLEVVRLMGCEGVSIAAAARRIGITREGARKRYRQAEELLREKLPRKWLEMVG